MSTWWEHIYRSSVRITLILTRSMIYLYMLYQYSMQWVLRQIGWLLQLREHPKITEILTHGSGG